MRKVKTLSRVALFVGAKIALALLSACAVLPERGPPPVPAARAEVARQVTVLDRQGPVSAATERRVLAALQAEGLPDLAARHLGVLSARGDVDLYRGNATRLLVDGPATLAVMKASIDRARGRVLLESYIFEDEGLAADFGRLLMQKASQGVAVALLYDGVGSFGSNSAFFTALEAGGVAVCKFNPINPLERPGYWGINHRNHRKVLVVDDETAFTGGINISRVYSSGSFRPAPADTDPLKDGWRDTHIELRGPVVGAFAAAFTETWASQGCRGALGSAPPATVANPGTRLVKVLASHPSDAENRIYSSLLAAIDASRVSVHLTMAYFAPGPDMIKALADAALRGVDVALVLPGRSDFALVLHAGRAYYQQLLEAGVRIHEMENAMMHAKTAVIDGVFSTVGSSNLDWRSFVDNNEINVIVLGEDFGSELEALFRRDIGVATPIDRAAWERRGYGRRLIEALGRMAERLL